MYTPNLRYKCILIRKKQVLFMSKHHLSKKSRGILYDIKMELQNYQINIQSLVSSLLPNDKMFRLSEFHIIVKEIDSHITYQDIDLVWDEINPNGQKFILSESFYQILKEINEQDNPYYTELDIRTFNIRESMGTIPNLSDADEIILGFQNLKDSMRNYCPWNILDLLDGKRNGKLSKQGITELFINFQVDEHNRPLIIKGMFGDGDVCSFQDFMKKLGLEHMRKKIQFDLLPDRHIDPGEHLKQNMQFLKKKQDPQQPKKEVKKVGEKKPEVKKEEKKVEVKKEEKPAKKVEEVIIKKIPPSLAPYYTEFSQMTEPLFSLARAQIEANKLFSDQNNPASAYKKWKHIKNIFDEDYCLFQKSQTIIERSQTRVGLGELIDANQINQGNLGNCYFMASIAATAELHPQLIYKLFVLDKNPASIYGIRLFVDGRWETIIVDAHFPVSQYSNLVYARPKDQAIWSLLIEKAWAKLYKCYETTAAGTSNEGLCAITGAPTFTYRDHSNVIELIRDSLKKKYMINIAGSQELNKKSKQWQDNAKLFSGHAYSVINLHTDLDWEDRKVSLIKLRNPWGYDAWRKNWSFDSKEWTNELRNRLNYHKDPNDGSFYMCVQDFTKYFATPEICKVVPKYVNSVITLTPGTHSVSVGFQIQHKGTYFFSMYQANKRKYNNSANYEPSKSWLFLARKRSNGSIEPVTSAGSFDKGLHVQAVLQPGVYIISCKIQWKYDTKQSFNLVSYAPYPIEFKQVKKDPSFLKNFIQKKIVENYSSQKKSFFSGPIATSYLVMASLFEEAYAYVLIRNKSDNVKITVKCKFQRGKQKHPIGIKPLNPDTLDFEVEVEPGKDYKRGYLLDPQATNYVFSFETSGQYRI